MEIYDLKQYLNISQDDYDYDQLITSLYESAKHIFASLTDTYLEEVSGQEYVIYNFKGNELRLPFYPVTSVDKIEYKDEFSDSYEELDSSKYDVEDNYIRFDSSYSLHKLKVTFDYGYSVIPSDIDFLLAEIVHYYFSYQALDIHLSSRGQVPLMPSQANLPSFLYEQIKGYKKFI